jgi:Flp pilus assembly pilin Flp
VAQIAEALRTAMHENAEIIDATTDETNIDTDVETSSASRTSASGGFSFNTVWHKIFGAKRVSEIPIVIEIKSPASVKSVRAYQPKRNVMRIVIEVTTVCLLISVGLIGTLRIIGTYVLSQFTSVSTTLGPESPSPTATSVEGNSLTIILVIAVFFILFFILLVLFLLVRWLVRRQHKRDT